VTYEVQVKAIKKRTLPELDDDFARELGEYESFADLEGSVREHLASRKRRAVTVKPRIALRRASRTLPLPRARVACPGAD